MILTQHQKEKLDEALDTLKTSNRLLIKGSAGVGKTTLANELVKQLRDRYSIKSQKIYCAAPTHKAVKVIQDKVTPFENLEFVTIHSALKLKKKINNKTGDVSFEPEFNPRYAPLKNVKLLILDEASMIGTDILMFLEEYASKNNTIIIMMGDEKQLPPVNEQDSPIFLGKPLIVQKELYSADKFPINHISREKNYKELYVHLPYPTIELTEVVRQKEGNPIIDLSMNLHKIGLGEMNKAETGGYAYTYDKDRIIEVLAEVNGTDEIKYLAYTNYEVDRMNNLVRNKIYGNPSKIELGETLVFNEALGEKYKTSQEIKVNRLEVKTKDFKVVSTNNYDGIKDYVDARLKVYSINPKEIKADGFINKIDISIDEVMVIHEDSEEEYKNIVKWLKNKAIVKDIKWTDFYDFLSMFADLKYNHALTIHKSQGSSYDRVIINYKDININKDKNEKDKLLYTGITRASELLIIYNL